MYRVLLVEGENLVRKAVTTMIDWEKHACRIVGEVGSGEQGLRMFRHVTPEIVITDIQMPVMNGLEMIRQMQQEAPATEFILLSSHKEFEAVRQAMELGVAAFILKQEMAGDVLLCGLAKAKRRLNMRRKLRFLSMNADIRGFFSQGTIGDSLAELLAVPQMPFLCAPAVQRSSLSYMDNFDYWLALNHRFCDYGEITSVVISEIEALVLMPVGNLKSIQRIQERGWAFAQEFQKYHKENHQFDIHIALGGLCTNEKQLSDCYLRARSLLMDGVFNQKATIVETQPKSVDALIVQQVHTYLQAFEELVENRRYEEAKVPASAMMDCLKSARYPPLFQEVVMSTEQLLGEHAKRNGFVYPYTTISQAEKALLATLSSLEQEQSSKYGRYVRQMLQYIHKHYQSEINLNILAGELRITAVYAGQIFKKETGETFAAYLTKYRINKAVRLLESGAYKIGEVSEMVGFQSVPYFSKVFKRITGKSPRKALDEVEDHDGIKRI